MMYRYPMHPETVKLIVEEQEKRRRARLLAREINRAVEESDPQGPRRPQPYWRWPMGIGAHAIAVLVLACCFLLVSAVGAYFMR